MTSPRFEVRLGDCREVVRQLADASVDAVVTDPPYELGFMGKSWDASGIAYDVGLWREVLRVLKPGGYLLAFGATRTYHRLACAIEDSGFEIRDSLHWVYGSGFPKSLDVSKAIDKRRHDRAEVLLVTAWIREQRDRSGLTNADLDAAFGFHGMAGHWTSGGTQPAVPTLDQVPKLLEVLRVADDEVPDEVRRLLVELNGRKGEPGEAWFRRESTSDHASGSFLKSWRTEGGRSIDETAQGRRDVAATDDARTWQGWGTALKPAHEPIVVARKPLSGTVAATVLEHGTGALNVDGCRVPSGGPPIAMPNTDAVLGGTSTGWDRPWKSDPAAVAARVQRAQEAIDKANNLGRWPPNVLLAHLEECEPGACAEGCAVAELDRQSGFSETPATVTRGASRPGHSGLAGLSKQENVPCHADSGGASRFFPVFRYEAKPAKAERNAGARNIHPTVKPVALMRWCIRLVTPKGGLVLDPFTGSGTTGMAAMLEQARFIGAELSPEYREIALARIAHADDDLEARQRVLFDKVEKPSVAPAEASTDEQLDLFGG